LAGRNRRRLAAGVLALAGAFVAVAGHGLVANGAPATAATPAAPGWGTFGHVATNDLTTAAAKQAVAQAYSVLVLRGPITSGLLSDLRQRRSGIVLLSYEKAAGLSAADVRTITARNPEWIARNKAGADIHPRNIADTTLGDLTNPAFRAWQAAQMTAEVAQGTDGAFIDTLGAYFPDEFYTSHPVAAGTAVTNAAWRDASADLLRRVKTATGKTVVANGFGLGSGAAYYKAPADSDVLIAAADGVQIEGFTRWGDAPVAQFRKADAWDQDLAYLALLGARGKTTLAYTKVNKSASNAELTSLRDYALASFLEAFTAGKSSFGFDDGRRIPAIASDAPWAKSIGAAAAVRTRPANGPTTWVRTFTNGTLTLKVASAPVVT
jgi:hypothetical protein